MNNIRTVWKNQASAANNNVIIRERISDIHGLDCYVGTIYFSKAKVFILELEKNTPLQTNYLKRFVGVEIQVLPLASGKLELVVILLENELSDIFSYFIEDIITGLIPVISTSDALTVISGKINYWKKLFSKFNGDLLTPQQQRGLYGELYFLKLLLENIKDNRKVITGWQAPTGASQDFYYDSTAIEIKTSKSNNPSIKISNELQLDITGLNKLYLAFYKLNTYPGNNNTLFDLIREIRSLISVNHDLVNNFNEKLESLGITDETEEDYNDQSISIRDEKYYIITPDFPKITRESIHEAIFGVSYEIIPIECTDFEQTLSTIISDIHNGSN